MSNKSIIFLKTYQQELLKDYTLIQELCSHDFLPVPDGATPLPDLKAERAASLADDNGFDGSLYRSLYVNYEPATVQSLKRISNQINTLSRIIAEIEKPNDRSIIPNKAELLTVSQVARLLGWGESVVRQRNREGLLPKPLRFGGTIQWSRKELHEWIRIGGAPRQKWETMKRKGN